MASWFASWIPSLPSIDFALPSALQRRFISFVLKRTLGHLLRPGQLNTAQIESQIGSGYVQINDLELDNAVSCHSLGCQLFLLRRSGS
jgi:autophagy-related protein 2